MNDRQIKKVIVTGAAGRIAYSFIFLFITNKILGANVDIDLRLYDIKGTENHLQAVKMEMLDCAFDNVVNIDVGTDPEPLFEGVDIAVFLGAKPRGPGMERSDLLLDNGKIFQNQGLILNKYASKNVKSFVVGNPCNTNCLILLHNAPSIQKTNFYAMMSLDEQRAKSYLAIKAGVEVKQVTNMLVWGNHSSKQVPDYSIAKISGKQALDVIQDKDWFVNDFMPFVRNRGASIIKTAGQSSVVSAAIAVCKAIKDVEFPTIEGDFYSNALYSKGNSYGIDEDLIFGFPCRSNQSGDIEIVNGLSSSLEIEEQIKIVEQELKEEREAIKGLLQT